MSLWDYYLTFVKKGKMPFVKRMLVASIMLIWFGMYFLINLIVKLVSLCCSIILSIAKIWIVFMGAMIIFVTIVSYYSSNMVVWVTDPWWRFIIQILVAGIVIFLPAFIPYLMILIIDKASIVFDKMNCRILKKLTGIEFISPEVKKIKDYNEWLKQQSNQSKDILHDTVSCLLDRTKDFDEFKLTLTNLGYIVYDNYINEEDTPYNKITMNIEKLLLGEDDDGILFYIPGTNGEYLVAVKNDENLNFINDTTASCNLKKDQSNYKIFTKEDIELKWDHDKLLSYYDKAQNDKNEIKVALPSKCIAIRLSTLNPNWKKDALIEILDKNNLLFTDALIKRINSTDKNKESFKKNKELFEQVTGISNIYKRSKSNDYQQYMRYEWIRIQEKIKEIENIDQVKVETQEPEIKN